VFSRYLYPRRVGYARRGHRSRRHACTQLPHLFDFCPGTQSTITEILIITDNFARA